LKETFGEDPPLATRMPATPAIEGKHEDHHNTLDGKVLQKARVLALAPAQTATRPVVAPKLRQNRIKCSKLVNCHSLRFKCRATAAIKLQKALTLGTLFIAAIARAAPRALNTYFR
jgi:hypothetical protein